MDDPRIEIRKLFTDRLDAGPDQTDLPALAADVVLAIRADPVLLAGYVDATLQSTVYEEGLRVLASRRVAAQQAATMAHLLLETPRTDPATPGQALRGLVDQDSRTQQRRLKRWLTHTEFTGEHHVRLLAMTGQQIDQALAVRRDRQAAEEPYIRLLSSLRQRVGVDQQVQDVMSAAEIASIYERVVQPAPAPIVAS